MNANFVESGCNHCRKTLMPVSNINMNLPLRKRIDIVDCYEYEGFRMKKTPIMQKFDFDGYPTSFVGGIKIVGILSKKQLKNFLDGFFEKDKIVPEEPEFVKDANRKELRE